MFFNYKFPTNYTSLKPDLMSKKYIEILYIKKTNKKL